MHNAVRARSDPSDPSDPSDLSDPSELFAEAFSKLLYVGFALFFSAEAFLPALLRIPPNLLFAKTPVKAVFSPAFFTVKKNFQKK